MNVSRRSLLQAALGMPAAAWLQNYRVMAAPHTGLVKITKIKSMGLDNVRDGCLVRIETDAGIVGYREAGLPSAAARTRIEMMAPHLTGQDPLGAEPAVRNSLFPAPEGPGLGLELNEDWLRAHIEKGDSWWG